MLTHGGLASAVDHLVTSQLFLSRFLRQGVTTLDARQGLLRFPALDQGEAPPSLELNFTDAGGACVGGRNPRHFMELTFSGVYLC